MRRLTRWLKRLIPWENGPKVEQTPAFRRLLRAFRLDSPAWEDDRYPPTTRSSRIRALLRADLPRATQLRDYRAALADLVVTHQATNDTPISLAEIDEKLFGGRRSSYSALDWFGFKPIHHRCQALSQLEFVLLYGALEHCLTEAAARVRRPPPTWKPVW